MPRALQYHVVFHQQMMPIVFYLEMKWKTSQCLETDVVVVVVVVVVVFGNRIMAAMMMAAILLGLRHRILGEELHRHMIPPFRVNSVRLVS